MLKNKKKAGALVGLIFTSIVVFSVILTGMFESTIAVKTYPDQHLFVDQTILLKTNETNETVDIICILYLTNIWEKESGELKGAAYVIETENNFAISETEIEIGLIKADSTTKIEIPIVLSNNSYKVKVLLYAPIGALPIDLYLVIKNIK